MLSKLKDICSLEVYLAIYRVHALHEKHGSHEIYILKYVSKNATLNFSSSCQFKLKVNQLISTFQEIHLMTGN